MADVSVRPARPDDAVAIGRIQVEAWRTGYREIIPAAVLDGLDADSAAATWQAAIATPPGPQHRLLVAQEQDLIVGFVVLAPGDDDASAEIGPLLVEPRFGRRGHGSRLLAAAVDTATGWGRTRVVAWLPELDSVSRTFFGSAGWGADGYLRALDTGSGEIREIRIHTAIGEVAATG